MSENIVLGVGFGGDSVQTLAVCRNKGAEMASAASDYPRWMEKTNTTSRSPAFGTRDHGVFHQPGRAAGGYADVASAQKIIASRIEHTYMPEPDAVKSFEALYQRHLKWVVQSEPMYTANQEES